MPLSRERYVTVCQQVLVTAAVLGVGLSSAGVLTLQIVAPERGVSHHQESGARAPAATHGAPDEAGLGRGLLPDAGVRLGGLLGAGAR
ncbi:MAG TPA: hypothetical protein VFO98_04740 [Marmoricola sp.]|jgi:hypothetical protein|nr:hypothetical protein [Marmoricola sp.]